MSMPLPQGKDSLNAQMAFGAVFRALKDCREAAGEYRQVLISDILHKSKGNNPLLFSLNVRCTLWIGREACDMKQSRCIRW